MNPNLIIFITFAFAFQINSIAQNQANIWYFGEGAGLTFNDVEPRALDDGRITITSGTGENEGSSVISDNEGNLLFYSDGQRVWNNEHSIMPNGRGLLGHNSSTHAAFIVPFPLSSRFFYLFTTDSFHHTRLMNGLRYSVIDMCLYDGLGDVIPNQKNILLEEFMTEKIAVTRHANGIDYWIVTHKYKSADFLVYHLTPDGIDLDNVVISNIGAVHEVNNYPGNLDAAIGQMKISPNGSKLALSVTNTTPSIHELFDFNTTTGVVTNVISFTTAIADILNLGQSSRTSYGVEFSPDNSKLYFSHTNGFYQFNLNAGNNTDIINSFHEIRRYITTGTTLGLQLAPNGKIYVSHFRELSLSVIENPNELGDACNFIEEALPLNGQFTSFSFPSFIAGFDYSNEKTICETDCAGVFGGENILDDCGACLLPNDAAFNQSCADCADTPNGNFVLDECGACLLPNDAAFNQSCTDCANTPNGNFVLDECGECLSPNDAAFNQSCTDCSNTPNGNFVLDECGACLSPNDAAFNQSCTDCANTPNGNFVLDECGACLSPNDPLFNLSCLSTKIFIPNAFSPNDDDVNDLFQVYSNSTLPVQIINYIIYNRWAQKVYAAKNFDINDDSFWWDGMFNNKKQPLSVYTYYVEAEVLNEPVQKFKGNVTLVR